MRRPFVFSTLAIAPMFIAAVVYAQTPPPQTPPPPAPPAQPAAPKLTFKGSVGMLLVNVKPDQTAAFEEMMSKLRSGPGASSDAAIKPGGSVKVYKSQEPGTGGNALYVLLYDPATPGAEYSWLELINKAMTLEQQRDPATTEMYKRFAASVAGTNILNLGEVK